ncbi:glycosyltransferase family 1 protein [Piloderma croceum F 1598]|uniref:UDP-N-acetylglucosamine transferase subunit ALG14 n=1 Tax=Piloderma croceum (strain F 1598) TaxID=765440 RepID=A0A0C3F6C2_PILCF|nr:glycosyltransferase family 1 protein [Piloderma croceum F 1598]
MLSLIIAVLVVAITILLLRVYSILPNDTRPSRPHSPKECSIAIFLGSGGHTTEALTLVSALDFSRYTPRIYIVSEGDSLSAQKAAALEAQKSSSNKRNYTILTVSRARRVHQSLITTLPTAIISFLTCVDHITMEPLLSRGNFRPFADVLILNGPGTCLVLCAAVYVNRFFGLPSPRLVYIESFARVKSLSLSGRLLRPLVDRFVVQWPELLKQGGRGEYRGWLV